MKLTVTTFLTMDGVMQAPGGPEEDTTGGFTSGGWVTPYFDEGLGEIVTANMSQADAFLLGRRTYEIFAGYWPTVDDEDDVVAHALNHLPKYVASRTLGALDWQGSEVLKGDTVEAVTELKRREGRELQVHGSSELVHTLAEAGLVDEYHLLTFPVLLGSGKRLFPSDPVPTAFDLVSSRTNATGVTVQTYARAGEPEYGLIGN